MSNFNGQINISRDLRQNKQTVIGKYDITDIIFLCIGVGIAIIFIYFLGYSPFKITDEFTAIVISMLPMLLIISLGFKRVAGIRLFNYMRMKHIDKKSRVRLNRKFDTTQKGDKFLVGFSVDRKYVNKYIKKFLSYENLSVLSVRFIKDKESNKNEIYFILDLRYENNDSIFIDILDKFSLNKEISRLSYEDIHSLQKDIDLRFENSSEKKENNKIYMLNLYDIKTYKKFINKVKRYSDVICYFKKEGKTKFVNTFLIVEDKIKKGKKLTKLEKVNILCDEYGVIIDKLRREQKAGRIAISYLLTNPFNAYRVYK